MNSNNHIIITDFVVGVHIHFSPSHQQTPLSLSTKCECYAHLTPPFLTAKNKKCQTFPNCIQKWAQFQKGFLCMPIKMKRFDCCFNASKVHHNNNNYMQPNKIQINHFREKSIKCNASTMKLTHIFSVKSFCWHNWSGPTPLPKFMIFKLSIQFCFVGSTSHRSFSHRYRQYADILICHSWLGIQQPI